MLKLTIICKTAVMKRFYTLPLQDDNTWDTALALAGSPGIPRKHQDTDMATEYSFSTKPKNKA